ncbi:MAG: DUF58 domain-containing protein [Candidatus Hodarchaeales archaeon]|jgi:uncharacterized protein (DUF58 family)
MDKSQELDKLSSLNNNFLQILSQRTIGLVALFFFIIFCSIFLTNGSLIILLLPTFILLISARETLDKNPQGIKISATRELSRSRIVEGEEVEVLITITNNSNQPTYMLELKDKILPELQIINGSNLFLFSLRPYESITLSYSIKFHYIGIYSFDEIFIRHRDFLGLRIYEIRLSQATLPELQKIVSVVPKLEKVESLPTIRTEWMRLYGGYFHSKQVGHDSDFRGIREFQYGDVINRINWKASARKQKLLSNEYNWDKAVHAELILDATITAEPVWANSLRAVISLSEFLLRMRNSVGFSAISEFPRHLDSRIGKRQLMRITNKLLQLNTMVIPHEDILSRRLSVLTKKFSSKAVIIYISPFTNTVTLNYALELSKNGFNVLAIVPMSLEKQHNEIVINRPEIKEFPLIHQMVKTELLLDRLKIRNNLKNSGIHYIEWYPTSHFGSAIRHVRRI